MDIRPRRHSQILSLLREGPVESQHRLAELLAQRGICVAQATLSRDLNALGAVKTPMGYTLPDRLPGLDSAAEEDRMPMIRVVRMYVHDVRQGGTIVVLRTGPGHAQVVALELDRLTRGDILGSIAGDDTIFVACESPAAASELAPRFRAAAEIPEPDVNQLDATAPESPVADGGATNPEDAHALHQGSQP